ncbi:MAG: hypothetical protein HQL46_03995 [Gammaproteobacteria bacterium]|nr:hypothetical protein [Gammaproteobacteria bacterium]
MSNQLKQNHVYSMFDPQEDAISAYMGSLLGVVSDDHKQASNNSNLVDLKLTHKYPANRETGKRLNRDIDLTSKDIKTEILKNQYIEKETLIKDRFIAMEVSDEQANTSVPSLAPEILPEEPASEAQQQVAPEVKQVVIDNKVKGKIENTEASAIEISDKAWTDKLGQELQKIEINKIRYRNLKNFLSDGAGELEIEAVSRKKIIIENNQLKKNLFEQKQINQELNLKVENLSDEVEHLKQLEFSKYQIDKNIPSWAVPDFQVMNIFINKLKIGIPFHALHSVLTMEVADLYPVQTRQGKNLFVGKFEFEGQTITLLDLKSVIFPHDVLLMKKDTEFSVVVIKNELNNSLFALLCDEINQLETQKYQHFSWKSSRSSRKWLAATNRQDKCVIIDIKGLFHLIEDVNQRIFKD